ncbi:MAG: hypothetical protein ACR2GY_05980 [Phycisphaerales bacterium]
MGEWLLSGSNLEIAHVNADTGMIVLQAGVMIENVASILQVVVDTKHGYAPAEIRRFDRQYVALQELIEIDSFAEHDGIWVPASCNRTLFSKAPLPAETIERIRQHRERIAVEKSLPPEHP